MLKCICLERLNIWAFHGDSHQLSYVKGQNKERVMDGHYLLDLERKWSMEKRGGVERRTMVISRLLCWMIRMLYRNDWIGPLPLSVTNPSHLPLCIENFLEKLPVFPSWTARDENHLDVLHTSLLLWQKDNKNGNCRGRDPGEWRRLQLPTNPLGLLLLLLRIRRICESSSQKIEVSIRLE